MTIKLLKNFLKDKGLKFTKEREEIIREIENTNGHFDPDELYVKMKSKGAKVSRASIYRTINLLLECGAIEVVENVDRHKHYEKISDKNHHDHMICLKCGKVIEFHSPTLEMLQKELCDKENFTHLRHSLEIYGYCRDCSKK